MITQFEEYLTFENIYLWINLGILPFWVMLIAIPNSQVTKIFVNSIILPLILATTYVYLIYQAFLLDEKIIDIFKLYISLDNLYTIFATETFLLTFWIHFVAINFFLGSWISRDSIKYGIPKKISLIPLLLVYFAGPVGLLLYWVFRIFYARKLGFHD